LMRLNPVSYEKKQNLAATDYPIKENGFIAQELQKIIPTLVSAGPGPDQLLSVNYIALIPVLTKAIQEQQTQIDSQSKLLSDQSKQIAELKLLLEQLLTKKQ